MLFRRLACLSPLLPTTALALGPKQGNNHLAQIPLASASALASTCAAPQPKPTLSTLQPTRDTMTRGPVIALSHGGGPMPLLGDPNHKDIVSSLTTRVPSILRLNTTDAPRAILLVTAHWSEAVTKVSSGAKHSLLYDYYGFPEETYQLKYDAPGAPDVAAEVAQAIQAEGLPVELDDERGWDHGVFVPMMLINPAANIPIVQISVLESESPAEHLRLGRALGTLREKGLAIVGSGFASFHNLRLMFSGVTRDPEFRRRNDAWSEAVGTAVGKESYEARSKALQGWREFPASYESHPRGGAEHMMPLIVAAGAGGDGKVGSYADSFLGMNVYSYYWE